MPLYECVLIARNDVTQQQVEAIADQVAATVGEGGGELAGKRRAERLFLVLFLVVEQDVCERTALGHGVHIGGGGSSRDMTICTGAQSRTWARILILVPVLILSLPVFTVLVVLVFVLVVPIVFILIGEHTIEFIEIRILPGRNIAKVDEHTHGRHLGRESLVLCIRAAEELGQRERAVGRAGPRRSRGRGGNIGGLSVLLV